MTLRTLRCVRVSCEKEAEIQLVVAVSVFFVMLLGSGVATAAAETCFGSDATMVGTAGSDQIVGTAAADVIVAGGGDDVITGGNGDDQICGGPGDDTIHGGIGAEQSRGGEGNDVIYSGTGNDEYYDYLLGGGGDDRLIHNPPRGYGDAWFVPGPGQDHIRGLDPGWGEDVVSYEDAPRSVRVDLANHFATGQGRDTLIEVEKVFGSRFDDIMIGDDITSESFGWVDNWLWGRGGTDRLLGRKGSDWLMGGPGRDRLFGGQGDDTMEGEGARDWLFGGYGADVASGGYGNDRLYGGIGNDALLGDWGNDFLDGSAGRDRLEGGPGRDKCINGENVQGCEGRR